jgi:prepilin-type N-terminal cleavage/methylation domain-containing protein
VRTGRQLKSRKGFSLVEILIAVVILSIVSIAAVGLFFAFTKHFEQSADLTAARQRGEMALSRLETAVLQAGLSMPNRTADFEKVFVVGTNINLITALRNATGSVWNEPVYLYGENFTVTDADGSKTEYFRKMGIVYCLSSGIGVLGDEHDVDVYDPNNSDTEHTEQELELSTACPENQVRVATSPARTDGWVTFSGCQTPFVVNDITSDRKKLTVITSKRDLIPFFAELQYLRAMCAYVSSPGGASPQFYIQDVTRGPAQPAVEGVSQVLFSYDDAGSDATNVLTVHLLVRGNRRFPGQVTSGVPGWPVSSTITDEDRHYRLIAISASWRVRN